MKVQFLGTSFGAPSIQRHQQSFLVETNSGDGYLVDAGAPVLDILVRQQYDLTRLKGIFITHLHGDHMNGLMDLLNLAAYFQMHFEVWLPEQAGIDAVKAYLSMQGVNTDSDRIRYRCITEGRFFDTEGIVCTAVPTDHMVEQGRRSYGFLLEADGRKLYITGDLHPTLRDFPVFLRDERVDMIIVECAHFPVEDLLDTLKQCQAQKWAVVHVMPEEKYEELEARAAEAPEQLLLPWDGGEVHL